MRSGEIGEQIRDIPGRAGINGLGHPLLEFLKIETSLCHLLTESIEGLLPLVMPDSRAAERAGLCHDYTVAVTGPP